jgi:hypothetical protein
VKVDLSEHPKLDQEVAAEKPAEPPKKKKLNKADFMFKS